VPRSVKYDNRAVSEVVASLVILLIVSIAGTVLYSYSMNLFNSYWSSFGLQIKGREEQVLEKLTIIAIWWDRGNTLNLTVLNYGKIELSIDAIYINGIKALIKGGNGVVIVNNEKINIKITSPISILDEETYQVVAVSERGTRDEILWKA
jgi:hypothetical protein